MQHQFRNYILKVEQKFFINFLDSFTFFKQKQRKISFLKVKQKAWLGVFKISRNIFLRKTKKTC